MKSFALDSRRWAMASGIALFAGMPLASHAAGTGLSIVFGDFTDASKVCRSNGAGADATFVWTTTSTAATNAAALTGQLDGGAVFSLPGIASGTGTGGWFSSGRLRTADGSYTTYLANGSHTLTVCATQNGSNGNPDKNVCESQTVTINCVSADPCATGEFFGQVPANKDLCNKVDNNVPVQFRGYFGPNPTLTISGPDGFSVSYSVPKSGESCIYTHNWATRNGNNGGPGPYTFSVEGNGSEPLEISEILTCDD